MVDYSKLEIKPPLKWWIRYKFLRSSADLVGKFPILGKISRAIGYRFVNFGNSGQSFGVNKKYLELLKKDEENAHQSSSPYGYDSEIREIMVMLGYHQQLFHKDFETMRSESAALYREGIKTVAQVLKRDSEVSSMLDFGVSYGHMNAILAKQFKDKRFLGVDRSSFVKLYNERVFPERKNLYFYACDVFELLQKENLKNGLLFHARTLLLLPPSFIKKLYRAAFEAGFKYVVGFEQVGISRQTNKCYAFSEEPQPSVFYRDLMFIHNYPMLLRESGFQIEEIDLVKTNNPHPDLRFLRFVAKRV